MGKNKTQLQINNTKIDEAKGYVDSLYHVPFNFGNALPEDVLSGKTFTSGDLDPYNGVPKLKTGTMTVEDVTPEVQAQIPLINTAIEKIVGKTTGATATANDIVKGKAAYVGQKLVIGNYVPQSVTIDGVQNKENIKMVSSHIDFKLQDIPYNFYQGAAVVYKGEIHLLGGNTNNTKHYKWNGSEWLQVSTLPYNFVQGKAVVLNDEIHILGCYISEHQKKHYKWDGLTWKQVSSLPYVFYDGVAVVLNGKIHIMGSTYNSATKKYHYVFDGSTWNLVTPNLPYDSYCGHAVVLNDEIHLIGGTSNMKKHYKGKFSITGGTFEWTSVSTLPFDFYDSCAVVLNDEIHILGSFDGAYSKKHYKWNGANWIQEKDLPIGFMRGGSVVHNNTLHILGGTGETGIQKYFYKVNAKIYEMS